MSLRVVTWNLFHGRAQPPRDRDLLAEFAQRLAGWAWDVALLQEVPPWWPPALAAACSAQQRTALTSRNALLPLRRALAQRRPELMKSSGGGANAILVRGTITAAARRRLRLWPERRVLQAARDGEGRWFANLHATVDDAAAARRDIARAREAALGWAAGAPLVLGGDFNVRDPELPGFLHAAGDGVDHIFCRGGLVPARGTGTELLDRGTLSDHPAVRAVLERAT